MLTQSGPMCDVCGTYIFYDKSVNPFSVAGISGTLLAHDRCKPLVAIAGKDWRKLPPGPLRKAFEDAVEVRP
jgi:hypothetical protein